MLFGVLFQGFDFIFDISQPTIDEMNAEYMC